MVSCVQEVIDANIILRECMDELRAKKIPFNKDILVGTMIEVPSAALVADLIAPHVSFFSLGTNDLIQYTMAVDRGNENVAHLYKPTHMAILRLIDHVVKVSHEHDLWTSVCGQMAANPVLVPLLVGLGVDELSYFGGGFLGEPFAGVDPENPVAGEFVHQQIADTGEIVVPGDRADVDSQLRRQIYGTVG